MPKQKRFTRRTESIPTQLDGNNSSGSPSESVGRSQREPERLQISSSSPILPAASRDSSSISRVSRKSNRYWTVNIIDDDGQIKEERLTVAKLMVLPNGKRVVLDWNVEGQPIGEAAGLLGGFLGALSSHCQSFPINFEKWPLVPKELKDHAWTNTIQQKFQVSTPEHRKYIFDKIGKNWKDNRLSLYDEFYNELHDREINLQMRPEGIPVDQWAGYLQYRSKEKTKMCAKNATNREMQTIPYTLGSKSIARRRHELQIETGRSYGRAKMFVISHTKADGSFINEEAREINEQINAYSDGSVSSEKAFSKVFPKEHPGRVRGFGLGPCPSQIFGTTYASSSMPTSSNVEVDALKLELESSNKKIKALEESNKAMSEQVAFLMQAFGHQMNADSHGSRMDQIADLDSPGQVRRPSSDAIHDPGKGTSD